jgi:hypothetical protein
MNDLKAQSQRPTGVISVESERKYMGPSRFALRMTAIIFLRRLTEHEGQRLPSQLLHFLFHGAGGGFAVGELAGLAGEPDLGIDLLLG